MKRSRLLTFLISIVTAGVFAGSALPQAKGEGGIVGSYVNVSNGDALELKPDGALTFVSKSRGKTYEGKYTLDGDTVTMRLKHMLKKSVFRVAGENLVASESGNVWERQGVHQTPVALPTPAAAAPTVPAAGSTGLPVTATPSVAKAEPAPTTRPGPGSGETLDEIAKWIKNDLPPLGKDHIVRRNKENRTSGTTYAIPSASLKDCVLTVGQQDKFDDFESVFVRTLTVPLKDVDLAGLVTHEIGTEQGTTQSKGSYTVNIPALADRGKPFVTIANGRGAKNDRSEHAKAWIRVRDNDASVRLEAALRRAALLCGAPDRAPIAQAAAEPSPAKGELTPGMGATSAKMTNADVIRLVEAGLSELVIANSIRQAAERDFDLSPNGLVALKKGKVSDSLIVVMQSGPVAPVTAPSPTPTVPPRYDASLAQSYAAEKVAAAQAANGCTGIEMMGLYKNEIFDRAMGGGITEWLAKIRNNTGVTKIVIFGFRDQYGEQKTSQVQIRGGEIASPRVDMTQARLIQPVADLRLVSCQ